MQSMRPALGLFTVLLASPLAAQQVYVQAGATAWGALVHDFVVEDVNAKGAPGPLLRAGVGIAIASRYGIGVEATLGSNSLHGDYGSTKSDLGTMRTASAVALLDGPIAGGFRWRAGLGFLHYFADSDSEILRSGTTRFLPVAGVDFHQPVSAAWSLMASARCDFQRFTTPALRAHGFSQSQGVPRLSLALGLSRGLHR